MTQRSSGPTAAIAGISPGVQSHGIWAGRRQLFVRFAAEAETAVLYSGEMLAKQIDRAAGQTPLHSICFGGRDPLASAAMISAAFQQWKPPIPVMLDCDGQRPESLAEVFSGITLLQVTFEFADAPAVADRALASLGSAAHAGKEHAAVLAPREGTSDGQIMRFVEQAHAAAPGTSIIIHPWLSGERGTVDRRYASLLERAMAIHRDTRLAMRIPGPVGVR